MRVLITGATGLIGKAVVKECHALGYGVHYLTSSKQKLTQQDNYKGFYWSPSSGEIDIACFEGVSALIHLVGASISKRWTEAYKKEVLESRTLTTQLLKNTIEEHGFKIDHMISASAIGIYPSSITKYYEEDATEVSTTFLGEVVEAWEAAVDEFKTLDIPITKIRIGLVLAADGGALPEIVKPIKFGAGAAFGNGEQWQSWIHVEDLARIFAFVLEHSYEGIFNGVAPNPVSNSELTKVAARVLKRPLLLPNIPKSVMKLMLGEMHMLLFESQRVSGQKIENFGFHFNYPNLRPALEDLLT